MAADSAPGTSLTNYCSFADTRTGKERIGHYDEASGTIQPLAHRSGTWLTNMYEVIEVGEEGIIASGEPIERSSTKVLAPINGRDILCVGKNYAEHAKEFNKVSDAMSFWKIGKRPITDEHSPVTTAQIRLISQLIQSSSPNASPRS